MCMDVWTSLQQNKLECGTAETGMGWCSRQGLSCWYILGLSYIPQNTDWRIKTQTLTQLISEKWKCDSHDMTEPMLLHMYWYEYNQTQISPKQDSKSNFSLTFSSLQHAKMMLMSLGKIFINRRPRVAGNTLLEICAYP